MVPAGVQLGLGVKTAAVYRIHDQGEFVNTENSFDLAIQGSGYFVVELPTGELAYTRSGNFQISPEGQLATPDGYLVSPGVAIPEDAVEVSINQEGLSRPRSRARSRSRSWASCSLPPSSTRPAGGHRQQPPPGDRRLGLGACRAARHRGLGTVLQGSSRAPTSTRCRRSRL